MAISLSDIHNAYVDYFSSRVVTSITVAPLSGQAHINPGEQFNITHKAKNSADEVFLRAGLDTQGINLFRLFLEAGLPAPEMDLVTTVGGPDWAGHEQIADVTSALLPLMVKFGIATEEEVQVKTLQKRLREEAARLPSVSMALGLMNVWTRIA